MWGASVGGVEEWVWGKCRKMLGEVWGSVLGSEGRCGKVCWGVGTVRGDVGGCGKVY